MLAYTAINVPYSALLAVISPVAEERTKATQFGSYFASLGTLCVGAFATPLVGWLGGDDEVLGFRLTIILFAILSVLIFWITFATTRERIRPTHHESSVGDDFSALFRTSRGSCWLSPAFWLCRAGRPFCVYRLLYEVLPA